MNNDQQCIMERINNVKLCRKIVVTGGVGVGKSTLLDVICEKFYKRNIPCIYIKEFIDGDINGKNMLADFLSGKIDSFDFQYYVLKYYDEFLENLYIKNPKETVIIFERLPDDSVTCFANKENMHKRISDKQLYTLYEYTKSIDKKYSLLSYFNDNENNDISEGLYTFQKSENTEELATYVMSLYDNFNNNTIMVCLYNTVNECLNRIIKRGRESEVKSYTHATIEEFNKHYTNLYSVFMSNGKLRYCDLDNLIK